MRDVKLGDPAEPDTQMGPIANRPQFERVLEYLRIAESEGAKCVLGGKSRPDLGSGQFIEPTILVNVRNDMRIAREEVFGPVLVVIPFKDEEDAIRIDIETAIFASGTRWAAGTNRASRRRGKESLDCENRGNHKQHP